MEPSNKNSVQQNISNRRKFLTKSAAVITTVAAKPVWASNTSISGNLSGNLSGRTHEQAFYDGCSPGYYHMHTSKTKVKKSDFNQSNFPDYITHYPKDDNNYWVIEFSDTSKLDKWIYKKYFSEFFNRGPSVKVFEVLSPKYWGKNGVPDDLKIERFALTAYLNAWDRHSGVAPSDFPYTKKEVRKFYRLYYNGEITESEAQEVLTNLIHMGDESKIDSENC